MSTCQDDKLGWFHLELTMALDRKLILTTRSLCRALEGCGVDMPASQAIISIADGNIVPLREFCADASLASNARYIQIMLSLPEIGPHFVANFQRSTVTISSAVRVLIASDGAKNEFCRLAASMSVHLNAMVIIVAEEGIGIDDLSYDGLLDYSIIHPESSLVFSQGSVGQHEILMLIDSQLSQFKPFLEGQGSL